MWVKLNVNLVCFGVQGNKFGVFILGKNVFIWVFMFKYFFGSVICLKISDNRRNSLWGCDLNKEVVIFFMDERNNIIGFCFVQFNLVKILFVFFGYYLFLFYLIFFMGKSVYGFYYMVELCLWYGEDLQDISESDNGGCFCVDVYGFMQFSLVL